MADVPRWHTGAAPSPVGTVGHDVCLQPPRCPEECGGALLLLLTEIVVGKWAVVPLLEGLSGNGYSSDPFCPSSPPACWGLRGLGTGRGLSSLLWMSLGNGQPLAETDLRAAGWDTPQTEQQG